MGHPRKLQGTTRLGEYLRIPIVMAAIPVVSVLIGWWLDRKLGTFPWLTIGLLGLGFFAGAREIWMRVKRSDTKEPHP